MNEEKNSTNATRQLRATPVSARALLDIGVFAQRQANTITGALPSPHVRVRVCFWLVGVFTLC